MVCRLKLERLCLNFGNLTFFHDDERIGLVIEAEELRSVCIIVIFCHHQDMIDHHFDSCEL